jgi:hypothetical protein
VYSTCLFCNKPLGANEVVEVFPMGRRLAFDKAKGRLWVVCRRCEKWNLTPFEERWEAIDACERFFHDTRKRISTDQIGLARLDEGLELVRIGEPKRPEFAAWRYGDQIGRRRRKALIAGTVGVGVIAATAGLGVAGVVAGGMTGVAAFNLFNAVQQLGSFGTLAYQRRRCVGRFVAPEGSPMTVRGRHTSRMRLVGHDDAWALELPAEGAEGESTVLVTGADARRLAALLVPRLTHQGATREQTLKAVRRIETGGGPEPFLNCLARNPPHGLLATRWRGTPEQMRERDTSLAVQGLEIGLAVEMAVNEENERRALDDELALLAQAWKDAEEIAAIADELALPSGVSEGLRSVKARRDKA